MAGYPAASPLRLRAFRTLWISNLVANLGATAQAVTAAWLMTQATGGNPALVAGVQTAAALPIMLFSLPAGALADLFDRRHIMIAAQSLTFAAAAGLTWAASADRLSPALILMLTFASGSGFAIANPAWHASLRTQVQDERLVGAAVLLNAVGFNLARSAGPAIGGTLLVVAGAVATLAIGTAAVVPLIGALLAWRPAPQRNGLHEPIADAVASGMRYVRYRPALHALVLRAAMFTFCGASIWALAPVVAHERFGSDASKLGTLVALFGAGAFAAALARAHFAHLPRSHLLASCTWLYAGAIALLAYSTTMLPAGVAMTLAGFAWVAGLTGLNVAIQIHAARWVAARAISLLQVALFLGLAIGSFCWGMVADGLGTTTALLTSAVALLATSALARWLPVVSNDDVDLTNAAPIGAPSAHVGVITVEHRYTVRELDLPAFAELMRTIGQARRRDGARRWSLARGGDGTWIERYEHSDARAAARFHERRTVEDEALDHELAQLVSRESNG